MRNIVRLFVGFVGAMVLILPLNGCGQKTVKVEPAAETVQVADTAGQKAAPAPVEKAVESAPLSEGAGQAESLDSQALAQDTAAATVEGSRTSVGMLPVYFDFDRSTIKEDQVSRMETNAAFLKANPDVKIKIEGNCDERGTNEYNMALGERRAMSAKKYMANLGVAAGRLATISYGEERPINYGHDELSWSQNRRADFVIAR